MNLLSSNSFSQNLFFGYTTKMHLIKVYPYYPKPTCKAGLQDDKSQAT